MKDALVLVTDANGDKVTVIGPFASSSEAQAYCKARYSKRGEYYTEVLEPQFTPEELDWDPSEDVYTALGEKI